MCGRPRKISLLCFKRCTWSFSGPGRKGAFAYVRLPEQTTDGANVATGCEYGPGPLSWGAWLRLPEKPGSWAVATARTLRKKPPARSLSHPSPSPGRIPTGALAVPALPPAFSAHSASPAGSTLDGPGLPAIRSPPTSAGAWRLCWDWTMPARGAGRPAARLRSALRPAVPGARAAGLTVPGER